MIRKPYFGYPIVLDLKKKPVVVIGGGAVAERKVASLLQAKADVLVISPFLTPVLARRFKSHEINVILRNYQEGDLQDAVLSFAATDNAGVNVKIAEEGMQKGIWVNVADQSIPGDFIVPASFTEKGVMISVSTRGKNPARAVKIRDKIKQCFSQNILRRESA